MGGLVDYSSSSSASSSASKVDDASSRPLSKKRRKVPATDAIPDSPDTGRARRTGKAASSSNNESRSETDNQGNGKRSGMPPLPSAFHDLYASTVRQSITDDPALHHGRKRQVPHIVGQWPSHVYVEWYPSTHEYEKLTQLIHAVRQAMGDEVAIHDFLTSDLGAPLPLHISLSRPLSLSTAAKELYHDKVTSLLRESGVGSFHVHPVGLGWFKSPDSGRSFLVIQVSSRFPTDSDKTIKQENPELMTLLKRCNVAAVSFEQPPLYQNNKAERVEDAFHVSIAWTLGLPSDNATLNSLQLFKRKEFESINNWTIAISGIKVKIGNSVHHVALGSQFKEGELFD